MKLIFFILLFFFPFFGDSWPSSTITCIKEKKRMRISNLLNCTINQQCLLLSISNLLYCTIKSTIPTSFQLPWQIIELRVFMFLNGPWWVSWQGTRNDGSLPSKLFLSHMHLTVWCQPNKIQCAYDWNLSNVNVNLPMTLGYDHISLPCW